MSDWAVFGDRLIQPTIQRQGRDEPTGRPSSDISRTLSLNERVGKGAYTFEIGQPPCLAAVTASLTIWL